MPSRGDSSLESIEEAAPIGLHRQHNLPRGQLPELGMAEPASQALL